MQAPKTVHQRNIIKYNSGKNIEEEFCGYATIAFLTLNILLKLFPGTKFSY